MACLYAAEVNCECVRCKRYLQGLCCREQKDLICTTLDKDAEKTLAMRGLPPHCPDFTPREEDQNNAPD